MEYPFVYDKYVTGRNYVGRKSECNSLSNLLDSGENVSIYEPQKSGKMSTVQQTLFSMRMMGRQFLVGQVSLFNVRTVEEFLLKFGSAVIRPISSTPEEYKGIIARYLEGTHFVFDASRFASDDEVISLNWAPDSNDIRQMLSLPYRIAEERGMAYYMIIEEFQNLLHTDEHEEVFSILETVFAERNRSEKASASYILLGSLVNAMKYIFEEKRWFHRQVEHLPLRPVEDREIIEHVVKGFSMGGKVIDRDLVLGACRLFRGDLWYLNHFTAICDSKSKGFINEGILMEALKSMISIHEPRFQTMVNDLTDHQLSLMRAILDGVVKFSSSDVIEKYRLNSSANVRRVKDALKKKEIITFNEKDEPIILDPLFEYWIGKYYFVRP
ncbi:MAG: hypothetical protein J6A22_02375 [Bacteroidales bacterium]|nr:hypothetical protein [Bacteroidales bacterium]